VAENLHDHTWVYVEIHEQRGAGPASVVHRNQPNAGKLAAPCKGSVERPRVDRQAVGPCEDEPSFLPPALRSVTVRLLLSGSET
jgi:hypothetical protein